MSFKFRFALLFSLLVFLILAVSAIYILILNEKFRKNEFFQRLHEEGNKVGSYYFDSLSKINSEGDLSKINLFTALPEEKVAILSKDGQLLFAHPVGYEPGVKKEVLRKAGSERRVSLIEDKREVVIAYQNKPVPHYTIISAFDRFGRSKSNNLLTILIISVTGGLLLAAFMSFFYVRQITKPLNNLKEQMQRINEQNLTERLVVHKKDDEVSKIALNFNEMLDRLEKSFETRKRFVQHASHELRTPLANMLSQTEVALNKDLSNSEYKNILLSLKEDQQDMIALTNSLLLLSQYETIAELEDDKLLRVDELIYETIDITKNVYRNAIISVDFGEVPDDESLLQFKGNEMLMKSAFQNLIRNACNYSEDNLVNVTIIPKDSGLIIFFDNRGRQLTNEEQQRVFIPFFRGDNSINKKGFGLGLSIVQRILSLHKASVTYKAIDPNLNRFIVKLPPIVNSVQA